MKFDKIIMNPPYSGNLHLKILKEAKKYLNENGHLIDLSPIRFAQSLTNDKNEYNWLNNSILSLERFSRAEAISLFQNRISFDLMVLTIGKNGKSLDDFNPYELRGLNPKLLSIWNKIQSKFTKAASFASFIKKPTEPLRKFSVIFNHMGALTKDHNHVYENGKFNGKKYIDYVKNQHKNESTDHFEFDSFKEADNFRKTIFTNFMKFLILSLKINERIIMRAIPWMGDCINTRTGKKGYESEWTDEDFYAYFGITEEEQKLIEETMKKYK